jgi:hypothetical protein
MGGNLLDRARRDSKKYITKGGFQDDIILETVDGLTTIETTGFVSKHWINFGSDGLPMNSKNAHITLDESALILLNYPVRNNDNEVHLQNHRVRTKDSTGQLKTYVIKEWYPDETLGLIACILGDFEETIIEEEP